MKMKGKADLLVLGNVITMDEHKPYAEAVAVKGDRILYVGAAEVAKKICDDNTRVCDFGKNSVYPGFLEAHCHTGGSGYNMACVAQLDRDGSYEDCIDVMKDFMGSHPDSQLLSGMGFSLQDDYPTAAMLDEICPDRIMALTDAGGHAMWLNSKAMEEFGINNDAVAEFGTDCVIVDENGNPTGYIAETAAFYVRAQIPFTVDTLKKAILGWEDFAISKGYTGVYDAGLEILSKNEGPAYYELEKEGKLKLYTFAGSYVVDNTETPEEDMDRIAEEAIKHNGKHFKLIGAKVFCDGTVEQETAWMLDDYVDQPGFKGVSRFNDHDIMVRLIKAASKHNMNVHIHAIGDAASNAWVDAIAEAQEATGDFDMRNAIAHLQIVHPDVIRRIGEYNIIAVCGMMWVEKTFSDYEIVVKFLGEEMADAKDPVKSFMDHGAVVVSHSDFPVSVAFSVPQTICYGNIRYLPSNGKEMQRKNSDECISRIDTLKALTTNVAYSWHAEDEMGSLEVGKLANIAVFDKDFMNDSFEEIENAECLATFIDGELVYKA